MTYQFSLLLTEDEPLNPEVLTPSNADWSTNLDLFRSCKLFALDIETWGEGKDDGLKPWEGFIRIISVGLINGYCLQIDLGGRLDARGDGATATEEFLFILKRKLKDPKVQVIGHNLKFDLLFLKVHYGMDARNIIDTMIMSRCYWAGVRKFRHSLKAVCDRLDLGEVDKTEQRSDWSWTLTNTQKNYAATDSLIVIQAALKLSEMCHEAGIAGPVRSELSALPAWVMIEYNGMPVCWETLQTTLKKYREVEATVVSPFTSEFPDINPASPAQVKPALEERYSITIDGSDQAALAKHWDKPAIRALTVWRSLRTYIAYLESIEEHYKDGSVRSSYNPVGPMGTRSNSSKPNLQNPPRGDFPDELKPYELPPVRGVFKAPKGYKLLISDLSQAHARLATEISGDKTLIDSYNSGADTHCITAAALAKVQKLGETWTPENIGKWRKDKSHENHNRAKQLRQVSKPTYYGSLNGSGGGTLQRTAKTDADINMTLNEAKEAIQAWRQAYNGLYKFQLKLVDEANKHSHVFAGQEFGEIRGLSNRRIFIPKWPSDFHDGKPSVKLSDACACTWAGDEKTVMALAMGEKGFLGSLDEHPEWNCVLVNNCHDELDALVPEKYALEAAAALQNKMQAAMRLLIRSIPVDEEGADPESMIADSWADK